MSGSAVRLPQISDRKELLKSSAGNMQLVAQRSRLSSTPSTLSGPAPPAMSLLGNSQGRQSFTAPGSLQRKSQNSKPVGMQRAKLWTLEVENAYRYQLAGFKDESEYLQTCPAPEMWPTGGMIKCLTVKATGFFMYFRQTRECEEKHLNKVKIYQF